jgi:hypothetical protein
MFTTDDSDDFIFIYLVIIISLIKLLMQLFNGY